MSRKEGFYECHDRVKAIIDLRIEDLQEFVQLTEKACEGKRISRIAHSELVSARAQIHALEELHSYVRNSILFTNAVPSQAEVTLQAKNYPTMTLCEVCSEPQYSSPGGLTCPNGHGGAGSK